MRSILKKSALLFLLLSFLSVGCFAADSIEIKDIKEVQKRITVEFDVKNLQSSDDVTILVFKKTDEKPEPDMSNIVYINQAHPEGSTLQFDLLEAASSGTYEVRMGGTGIQSADVATFSVSGYLPGDINGDGQVNVMDVTFLRRHNAGGYNVKVVKEAVDVNKDGRVTVLDITLLRRYNAGGYGVELK